MPVDSPVRRKVCLGHKVLLLVLLVVLFQGNAALAKPAYPIILIHGIASSGDIWEDSGLLDSFVEIGWSTGGIFNFELEQTDRLIDIEGPIHLDIITPQGDVWIVNFGSDSFDTSSAAAIHLQAKAVSLVVEEIKNRTNATKVILVGHSMGGLAAAAYIIGDPNRDGLPDFYRNDVAKLLTLGTPFEGSPFANLAALGGGIPFFNAANALRDLALATDPFSRNIFLFGGRETEVGNAFVSQDVNCDGHIDEGILKGIAEYGASEWPHDVSYYWIVGSTDAPVGGDCVVSQASQQRPFGERKTIDAAHASMCDSECTETESIDAIIEGLDEPDDQQRAWPIKSGAFHGFITHQGDGGSSLDNDYFKYSISAPTRINFAFLNGLAGDVEVTILDPASSGSTVFQEIFHVNGAGQADLLLSASSYPRDFYVVVRGFAPSSPSGIGEPGRACDSHLAFLHQPYRISLFPLLATTLSLTALPATMAPGGTAILRAQVREVDSSAVAGAEVSISPLVSGLTGCTPRGNACVTSTDANGIAEFRFTKSILGIYTFTASAQTGGSATASVKVALADTSASASPNPVAVDLPSTITVTYQPPPPAGTAVTFSTGYPGYFSGGSSPYSPSTVFTDANGTATIRFASSSVGTANITVDSASAASQVVPLQIYNPNATVNIQLAVSYVSGDSSSSTYRVEAAVTNLSGQSVAGEPVDFTTSAGSFCPPGACSTGDDITGSTGIGRANLTVTAAGTVTVRATVNSSSAATTFIAQIGAAGGTEMQPVRTFNLGAGGKVFGVDFTPDGTSLIASNYGSATISSWSTADWSQRWSITARHNRPSQVSVSGDGTQVVVATDRGAEIHSTSDGAWICDSSLTSAATFLATFAGGSKIFAASAGNTYRANACSSLALNAAGSFEREGHFDYNLIRNYVAGGDANGNINFWNSTGTKVRSISILNNGNAYDASWNTNGSRVVAVGKGGTIALINTSGSPSTWTKTSCGLPSMAGWRITAAVWLDNDTKVAVGGDNNGGVGRIEILDAANCSSFRFATTDSRVLELTWNPSTRELAAGTNSGSVYIFRPLAPSDTIAPTISITTPSEGAVTNQMSLETHGRATDDSGVSVFTINGSAVPLDSSGNFFTNVLLVEGTNTIEYHAADLLGNASNLTRSVILVVDRVPPVISGVTVTPSSGMAGTSFTISCFVSDGDTEVADVTATIRDSNSTVVASLPLVHGTGSSYSGAFDSTGAMEGGYSVDITAVDSSPQANRRTLSGAIGFTVVAPPQPPAAPTSLRISAGVELIELLWTDNSTDEDGFHLERRVGAAGVWTPLETLPTNTTFFEDSGLACGIPHTYRVRAFNPYGESAYSNEASATPPCACTPSLNPASISMDASGGSGSFTVNGCESTWTAASEAGWIEITGGATGSGTGTVSFQVTANAGTARTGTVRVAALDLTFTVNQAAPHPAAPTWLRTTATSASQIDLLWDDNSDNEDGFKIERKEGPAGSWTVIATLLADENSYQDATVQCGTPWAYRVWAFNAAGDSGKTNEAAATPECSCAESIIPESQSFDAVGESGSFAVTACGSWTAVSDVSWIEITNGASGMGNGTVSFQVARSNVQSPRTGTISLPELGLVFTVQQTAAPADPGFSSFLRLVSGAVAGQPVDSDHRAVTVAPGAVVSGTLSLRIDSSFPSNAVMALGITPSWGDHAVSYNDLGHFSTPASGLIRNVAISYTAPATPGTYHVLAAFRGEFNAGQVMSATNWGVGTLVWNNGDDLADWPAERIATANREGTVLADYLLSGGNVPMWVPATAITVVVEPASAQPPTAPTWLRTTPSSPTRIDLLWEDNSDDEDGFKIERKEGPAGPWTVIATLLADENSYQDDTVQCGTPWAYRVWAFNAAGDSGKTNEAAATPTCNPEPLLADDFEDGSSTGWQTWVSGWSESGGIYHATNTGANLRNEAVWAASYGWSDYTVEVDLTLLDTYGPADGQLLLRYNSETDRISCRLFQYQGSRELQLLVPGRPTVSVPFAYVTGQLYRLQASAIGDNVTCEVVEHPETRLVQTTLGSLTGTVGLRNTHIRVDFDNLEVWSEP